MTNTDQTTATIAAPFAPFLADDLNREFGVTWTRGSGWQVPVEHAAVVLERLNDAFDDLKRGLVIVWPATATAPTPVAPVAAVTPAAQPRTPVAQPVQPVQPKHTGNSYSNNAHRYGWKPTPYSAEERAQLKAMHDEEMRQGDEIIAAYEAEIAAAMAALHPAFHASIPAVRRWLEAEREMTDLDGYIPTNDECRDFVLAQIIKLAAGKTETAKRELRGIYKDVRDRGGDAYAEHKARLQAMNTRGRTR